MGLCLSEELGQSKREMRLIELLNETPGRRDFLKNAGLTPPPPAVAFRNYVAFTLDEHEE